MFHVEAMTPADVAEVSRVERRCFSNPWPAAAYRRELRAPDQNYYVVLRRTLRPSGVTAGERNAAARGLSRLPLLPFGRRPELGNGKSPILGFAGMWLMYDEAHITTIGVEPLSRGRGLGELLLVDLMDEAVRRQAVWLTLEVRVSNEAAQRLYEKYGFTVHGTRRRYYSDNNEDAHVMWSDSLRDPNYLARIASLKHDLVEKLSAVSYQPSVARFGSQLTAES